MIFLKRIYSYFKKSKCCCLTWLYLDSIVILVTGLIFIANLILIFLWAPRDIALGEIQRILYLHVPAAWVSFFAFFIVFCMSTWYVLKKADVADRIARSSAEIGLLFTTIFLISGILWAKPIWGVWWTWDPRLTTTLIMWLIYLAYLMVRMYAGSNRRAANWSAIIGILGFFNIPIVYASTIWWRTIHPQQMIGPAADASNVLPDSMRVTLLFSVMAFSLIFLVFLKMRCNILSVEHKIAIMDDNT